MKRFSLASACLAGLAACITPSGVRAQPFVLDTGTPAGNSYPILSNSQWFAAEFHATAGETVTGLSAYLTSMTGNGDNFAFEIYTNGGGSFLSTRNASLGSFVAYAATGTYTAPGWNTTSVDWVVPTTGDYWLAIEGDTPGTHNLPTFDVQQEASTGSGTVPALAFAFDTGTQFKTSGAVPIGLQVAAASVPEPAGWWFLAGGAILASCLRRDRHRQVLSIGTGRQHREGR